MTLTGVHLWFDDYDSRFVSMLNIRHDFIPREYIHSVFVEHNIIIQPILLGWEVVGGLLDPLLKQVGQVTILSLSSYLVKPVD